MAYVVEIYRSIAKGESMQSVWSVRAVPGSGLVGDRYYLGKGAFSGRPSLDSGLPVSREVTLISAEAIELAADLLCAAGEVPFSAAEIRRNIVTRGVDLVALVDKEFMVGPVRMRGVEIASPCRRINKLAGKKYAEEVFAGGGAGIRAQVLSEGVVFCGAVIMQLSAMSF